MRPRSVPSIAELRTLVHHENHDEVKLLTTEDLYRFDQASMSADDGDEVVKPSHLLATQPGRWKKIPPPASLPPDVGAWEVVFTRKVAAGVASDPDYVDTGIVYDPDYEYVGAVKFVATPTPDIASPSVSTAMTRGVDVISVDYKPDGATSILCIANSVLFACHAQAPAALGAATVEATSMDPSYHSSRIRMNPSGQFHTKWEQSMTHDGHWIIARRRRYG